MTSSINKTTLTRQTGCPIAQMKNSMTAGPTGPVLLQDSVLMEKITQFNREKIPARNVHALGTGVYGSFTVTKDITKYCKAKLFSEIGKKTDLFARFSGVFTEQGDAETIRDARGFALKFYTEEGNWDLLGLNTPVFNVRDGKVGPDAIHAFKRDPRTGMWNPSQLWDFTAHHPESLHQVLMLHTDRSGCPLSYRHMNAYGSNTFSFINHSNERSWIKFHLVSMQGTSGLTRDQAKLLAGEDPNFLSRDLKQSIDDGNFPKWKLCCQIMKEEEGYNNPWSFDCTKVWKHSDYPLMEIGIIELNRLPLDHFSEVEQVAFSPATVVPGIGFSPDKLLQGRLLIYDDTQHHRLGPNFKQLPTNRPKSQCNDPNIGGLGQLKTQNNYPHYWPSSFDQPQPNPSYNEPPFKCDGPADFYDYPSEGTKEDLYQQSRDFFYVLSKQDQTRLCENISASLEKVPESIASKVLEHFNKIDDKLHTTTRKILEQRKQGEYQKTDSEKLLLQLKSVSLRK